jgi:hypothetical protein
LHPGEALLLVAHPRAWDKNALPLVDQSVAKGLDDLGQNDVLQLCGRIETLLRERGSASLVIYRIPPDPDGVYFHDGPVGTAGFRVPLFEDLDTSLTSSDLEFLEELAAELRY